jgi:phospholipid/cholesterol/gamma-HCH transport system permease protein
MLRNRVVDLNNELTVCAQDVNALWDLTGVRRDWTMSAHCCSGADGAGSAPIAVETGARDYPRAHARTSTPKTVERTPDRAALLVGLGRNFLSLLEQSRALVILLGHLVLDGIYLVRHPFAIPWREILANIHRTGGQALPITALVGFLVGVVLSYLSARQLQTYGANIFIINILGIGIVRELGPMLAAILIAGRSGSSMTARLGVMGCRLDALSVMGISHTLRLVFPSGRACDHAPLLILWTNTIALIGGMLSAKWRSGHQLPPVPVQLAHRGTDL